MSTRYGSEDSRRSATQWPDAPVRRPERDGSARDHVGLARRERSNKNQEPIAVRDQLAEVNTHVDSIPPPIEPPVTKGRPRGRASPTRPWPPGWNRLMRGSPASPTSWPIRWRTERRHRHVAATRARDRGSVGELVDNVRDAQTVSPTNRPGTRSPSAKTWPPSQNASAAPQPDPESSH